MRISFRWKMLGIGGVSLIVMCGLVGFLEYRLSALDSLMVVNVASQERLMKSRELQLYVAGVWQFCTDASLTRDEAVMRDEVTPNFEKATRLLAELTAASEDESSRERYRKLGKDLPIMMETGEEMFRAYCRDWSEGNRVMERFDQACDAVIGNVEEVVLLGERASSSRAAEIAAYAAATRRGVALVGAVGGLLAILLILKLTRETSSTLSAVVGKLASSAESVSRGAEETTASSETLAQSSTKTAAALEESSASLTQISAIVEKSAERAADANAHMVASREVVRRANAAMAEMKTGFTEILEKSRGISQILQTIQEIGFQTNLLALNAAVEAARAGESGRGFAVVAEEVRSLARRASTSAQESSSLVSAEFASVERGLAQLGVVEEQLAGITKSVDGTATLVAEISTAMREQALGVRQISVSVNDMDGSTQSAAALSEQSATIAHQLSADVERVNEAVGDLQVMLHG